MKISEVINKLQEIKEEHGDIETYMYNGQEWKSMDRIAFNIVRKALSLEFV